MKLVTRAGKVLVNYWLTDGGAWVIRVMWKGCGMLLMACRLALLYSLM